MGDCLIELVELPLWKRIFHSFHRRADGMAKRPSVQQSVKNSSTADVNVPERTQWNNKTEFVLSCLSLSVGLGNVWRFPYLAYANGGGAFLLPYLIVLFLCGKPMYFMEIALGQYHQEGPVTIWKKVSPIGRGIGVAQCVVQFTTALYFRVFIVVIMAWTMYYFWATLIAACLGEDVPWGSAFCDSEYADKANCLKLEAPRSGDLQEVPVIIFSNVIDKGSQQISSAQQYFDRVIIMRYDKTHEGSARYSLNDIGGVNWILTANMAGCWLLVFLSLVKGITSAGKVGYVTSTLPFIVLIILLGRGASLPNAEEGILYFLIPRFSKLLDVNTWRNASEQMFYSLTVSFGSLVMLGTVGHEAVPQKVLITSFPGSYNKRHNNCYQDAMIVSIADTLTSVTAGLALFSILGHLAGQLDLPIENVAVSGPGLAFVTFPEAMTQMPAPHAWSILFFIMLFTLGLGSQIATVETFLTVLYDHWPELRQKKPLVCGLFCLICFALGFPFMMQGGVDLFDIFDSYGGFTILFPAFFEIVIVMWVYGLNRFVNNLKEMLGKRGDVSIYWRSTWGLLGPMTLFFILVITFVYYAPLHQGTSLPAYADGVGWALATVSIVPIPVFAGMAVYQARGRTFGEKLYEALWPDEVMEATKFPLIHLDKPAPVYDN